MKYPHPRLQAMFKYLFKSSEVQNIEPVLEPLVSDIHCHLLPSVDDGSASFDESVSLLRYLGQLGFKKIFLTPHFQAKYPNIENDISTRFNDMCRQYARLDDPLLPQLAGISGEYRFDEHFAPIPDVDHLLLLPGNRLLCEFSRFRPNPIPFDTFECFLDLGYNLILAHPERYAFFNKHDPDLRKLLDMGFSLQVNLLSLDGFYGTTPRTRALEYIDNGWVDFLATDTHNMHYIAALIQAASHKEFQQILSRYSFKNSLL